MQNARRDIQTVHRRIVVGIHRLRSHGPFAAVDRFADLIVLAPLLEFARAQHIEHVRAAVDLECRVIAPPVRIADAQLHLSKLLDGRRARGRGHPRESLQVGEQRVANPLDHQGRGLLGARRKVPRHVHLADGKAERVVLGGEHAQPPRL